MKRTNGNGHGVHGHRQPKVGMERVSVCLDPTTKAILDARAAREGVSLSAVIANLCRKACGVTLARPA